jgi:hypothetical protein
MGSTPTAVSGCNPPRDSSAFALREFLQQHLGLLEVSRVKALGEPAVDRRQQLVGCCALALALPQPAQAQRRAQLQGLRLLTAGRIGKTNGIFVRAPRECAPWSPSAPPAGGRAHGSAGAPRSQAECGAALRPWCWTHAAGRGRVGLMCPTGRRPRDGRFWKAGEAMSRMGLWTLPATFCATASSRLVIETARRMTSVAAAVMTAG